MITDVAGRESMLAEADMAFVFQQILDDPCKSLEFNTDVGLDLSRRMDLRLTPQQGKKKRDKIPLLQGKSSFSSQSAIASSENLVFFLS